VKYQYVSLGAAIKGSVHRFVCSAFHGPCPAGYQVGHLDGNPLNNRPENLRWVTPSENAQHKVLHGTFRVMRNCFKPGQKKRGPKPSPHPLADQIAERRRQGASIKALASQFRMSKSGMANVLSGRLAHQ